VTDHVGVARKRRGEGDQPRAGLSQVVEQLRSRADLLETMTPAECR